MIQIKDKSDSHFNISTFAFLEFTYYRKKMQLLVVLASIFGVGLCQFGMPGGKSLVPASEYPTYYQKVMDLLPALMAVPNMKVLGVEQQVF